MDINPYKFENANPRIVSNISVNPYTPLLAGVLFLGSLRGYQRKLFRIDNNVPKLALFTLGSAFASYQWALYFLSSPIEEAGL
jgi:hypothetical protein